MSLYSTPARVLVVRGAFITRRVLKRRVNDASLSTTTRVASDGGSWGRLRQYIDSSVQRRIAANSSCRSTTERNDAHPPLTTVGVQTVDDTARVSVGYPLQSPPAPAHVCDADASTTMFPLFQLQEALGHSSLDMVRRYYTFSNKAMARAFYQAFGAS